MENLRKIRIEKKMNQLNLGMKIGVDQVSISSYEVGKIYPSIGTLLKLCNFFNVSSDFLLDRTSIKTPTNQLVIESFTAQELELLSVYKKLPKNKRERALGILIGLSDNT